MTFLSRLRLYIDENSKYIFPPIWVITGLIIEFLCIGLIGNHIINTGAAFLWSLAYFVAGALVGLIFGVPNSQNETKTISSGLVHQPIQDGDSPKKNLAITNLTEISDWLTKIVIGAGLVELREIPPYVVKVATKMALGVAVASSTVTQASMICAGIIIYDISFGFMSGYLLMRIIFSSFI